MRIFTIGQAQMAAQKRIISRLVLCIMGGIWVLTIIPTFLLGSPGAEDLVVHLIIGSIFLLIAFIVPKMVPIENILAQYNILLHDDRLVLSSLGSNSALYFHEIIRVSNTKGSLLLHKKGGIFRVRKDLTDYAELEAIIMSKIQQAS